MHIFNIINYTYNIYQIMKSLVRYINESKNDIVSLLNNFKVDFSDVSSMPIHTVDQRYEKGKAQEKIFIDTMNNGALP